MTCPHKHVEARIWSRHFGDWTLWQPGGSFVADALICRDCGEWLGLGEAKDEGEAVRIERRAADIATALQVAEVPRMALCETHGYESHANGIDPVLCSPRMFWAGYLAREIATHSEPQ